MEATFINYFLESTFHVLETTASTKVSARKPYRKRNHVAKGEISCVINISGDLSGTVSLSFSKQCILNIVSSMFGEEMKELDDEIKDAVGEIANMIAGQATTKFTEYGKTVKAETATVIMGNTHDITHSPDLPVIALPYQTGSGDFTLEICFKE